VSRGDGSIQGAVLRGPDKPRSRLGRVVKRVLIGVLAAVALAAPAQAEARRDGVFCARPDGSGLRYKIKPRNCILASGPHSYQQAPIRKIRWRSWGGASAYGRGTLIGNMRFRAPVRFKLYRPRYYEFGFYVYTRARGTTFAPDRKYRWRKKIVY
jgi:hypothetical protein